ncbi:NAD(P)-dependent alcohol dehydrogenase [Mumia sp. Pv 4-285]|uniref:NAD(P)-dependent alcohol dehydrogenase n=1 Tax=Mumia qirimensis TaxID=3234852 RepID=UPI00351D7D48
MQAVIQDRYGSADVVRWGELPDPVPADDEILLRVRAVSLNGSDRENLAGRPAYARWTNGLRRPRNPVPGSDVAGVVAAVGRRVTEYAWGDQLYGELAGYRGGMAELVATRPKLLARKPDGLSFVEAAAIPQAGGIARRATAGVRPGDAVLVNGAGGAGGVFVVGLAKHAGAEVTAVDRGDKADFLNEIGADHTIDFAKDDWADERGRYDLIVDLVAERSPFRVHHALRPGGRYAMLGGRARILLGTASLGPLVGRVHGKRVGVLVVPQSRAELESVSALIRQGAFTPRIDSVYPLHDAKAALARLAAGDSRGKIVLEVPEG